MGLQYAIKEVYNVTFWDFATNKPFAYVDYATAGTNEVASENTPVRGGQGNGLITTFHHTKTSTFNLSVPLVDLKLLALLGGDDMVTGAQSVYKREEFTITGGTVTLSQTPVTDSQVVFALTGTRDLGQEYTKVPSGPTGNQYSISGSTLTFNASENGKKIVVWYQYTTAATANKVAIKANKFPKTVKITAEGLWRDVETDTDKVVAVTVHKAKPAPNFTLTTSSTDVTTLDMQFEMYTVKAANGDQQYIDYVVL